MLANYYIPPKLTGLVDVIWEQYSEQPTSWQILPSGKVELIFRLGPPVYDLRAKWLNSGINPTRHFCFLSGLHTKPLYLSFSRFHFLGAQMSPVAVKAIFGLPCIELRDWAIDGVLLFEDLRQVEDKLLNPDFYHKTRWLEDFLHPTDGALTGIMARSILVPWSCRILPQ